MNPANPLDTTELSVLVLAVNHYVRTSHYVGEPATILVFPNGTRSIAIPIFDSRPGATEDFERLKQRIDAIRPTFKAVGLNVTIEESPKGFGLTQHYLTFPAGAVQQLCLAGLLVSTRFPVRWGGPKRDVEIFLQHEPLLYSYFKMLEALVDGCAVAGGGVQRECPPDVSARAATPLVPEAGKPCRTEIS